MTAVASTIPGYLPRASGRLGLFWGCFWFGSGLGDGSLRNRRFEAAVVHAMVKSVSIVLGLCGGHCRNFLSHHRGQFADGSGELIKVRNAITVLWKSNLGCLTVVRHLPAIAEPCQEAKTLKLIDCDLVCIEQDISSSLQHEPGLHGF
jgi:hypothetical protein